MIKEFYTQKEAAKLLARSPEYVLKMMFTHDRYPLYPAVNFTKPVSMKTVYKERFIDNGLNNDGEITGPAKYLGGKTSDPEMKTGLFDLFLFGVGTDEYLTSEDLSLYHEGIFSFEDKLTYGLKTIKNISFINGVEVYAGDGLDSVVHGLKRFITLNQGGFDYIPCQEKAVLISDLLVSRQSLKSFTEARGIELAPDESTAVMMSSAKVEQSTTPATPEPAKKRYIIKSGERKSKGFSAIQTAVEAFLDTTPGGYKAGFYTFLKEKIKLTTKAILKDNEGYDIFFDHVAKDGSKEGVYLKHRKEGKKEGEPGWNHYSGSEITTLISREKGKRKK